MAEHDQLPSAVALSEPGVAEVDPQVGCESVRRAKIADALLDSMKLSSAERRFAILVGEKLAESAIDAYSAHPAVAGQNVEFSSSCITGAIAVALLMVCDGE